MAEDVVHRKLSAHQIFLMWAPLAATWLLMAVEQPFVNSLTARLPEPAVNLAATGVALAVAFIVESPILLILSASTSLIEGELSYRRLRNFGLCLSALLSLILAMLFLPLPFKALTEKLMDLNPEVSALLLECGPILIPVPAAVGLRRFFQGVLIKNNKSSMVAAGTVCRFIAMGLFGYLMYETEIFEGCVCASVALTAGMVAEAAVSWYLSRESARNFLRKAENIAPGYGEIARFYAPLALTGIIIMAQGPMVTFFLSHGVEPVKSLAVFPVVNGVMFFFMSFVISLQEVIIAHLGRHHENIAAFKNFLKRMGLILVLSLFTFAFTPLSGMVYKDAFGLSEELSHMGVSVSRIIMFLPIVSIWTMWLRAVLMHGRISTAVTWASSIELSLCALFMIVFLKSFESPAIYLTAIAAVLARVLSGIYLMRPYNRLRGAVKVRSGSPVK